MIDNQLNHVAIILDGNKRWAEKNDTTKSEGYKKGFDNIKNIINFSIKRQISNLTLFTLSSENLLRPSIKTIYNIIINNFENFLNDTVDSKNIKIKIIGSRKNLPNKIINIFEKVEESSKNNSILNLNLAFNYGFKYEVREVLNKYKKNINKINLDNFSEIDALFFLDSKYDPEILIRTGGYKRLSNFIMYNLTYTELFFTETLWPDFSEKEFNLIINQYLNINRKYGL